jgi:hypothetical protein
VVVDDVGDAATTTASRGEPRNRVGFVIRTRAPLRMPINVAGAGALTVTLLFGCLRPNPPNDGD